MVGLGRRVWRSCVAHPRDFSRWVPRSKITAAIPGEKVKWTRSGYLQVLHAFPRISVPCFWFGILRTHLSTGNARIYNHVVRVFIHTRMTRMPYVHVRSIHSIYYVNLTTSE